VRLLISSSYGKALLNCCSIALSIEAGQIESPKLPSPSPSLQSAPARSFLVLFPRTIAVALTGIVITCLLRGYISSIETRR